MVTKWDKVEFLKHIISVHPDITDQQITERYSEDIQRMSGILLTLPGLIWTARKELEKEWKRGS